MCAVSQCLDIELTFAYNAVVMQRDSLILIGQTARKIEINLNEIYVESEYLDIELTFVENASIR